MGMILLHVLTAIALIVVVHMPALAHDECRRVRITNTGILMENRVEGRWEGDIVASYTVEIDQTIVSTDAQGNTLLYAVGTAVYQTERGEIRTVDSAQIQLATDGSGRSLVHQVFTGGTETWANTTGAVNAFNDHAPDGSFVGQAVGEVCRPTPFN